MAPSFFYEIKLLFFPVSVRGKLSEHLSDREDISTESTIGKIFLRKSNDPTKKKLIH